MKDAHLHIRLESGLLEQVRQYAEQHHKTVTQIILEHFLYLLTVDKVQTGMVQAFEDTRKMNHGVRRVRRDG